MSTLTLLAEMRRLLRAEALEAVRKGDQGEIARLERLERRLHQFELEMMREELDLDPHEDVVILFRDNGNFAIFDPGSMTVRRNDQEIPLSARETKMLSLLTRDNGIVVTYQRLAMLIWGPAANDTPVLRERLRQHVSGLRPKIDPPYGNSLIDAIPGLGYRLTTRIVERPT